MPISPVDAARCHQTIRTFGQGTAVHRQRPDQAAFDKQALRFSGVKTRRFFQISAVLSLLMLGSQDYLKHRLVSSMANNLLSLKEGRESTSPFYSYLPPSWRLYQSSLIPREELTQLQKEQNIEIQAVSFKSSEGLALRGHWMPSRTESPVTVVMGHGYRMDWRMNLQLAQLLHKSGYNVFLFDFRAHGASSGVQTSLGLREGRDIAGAVKYVANHYAPQAQDLFYYGHSMGAASALLLPYALAEYPDDMALLNTQLKGFILDSSFVKINPTEIPFIQSKVESLANTLSRVGIPNRLVLSIVDRFNHSLVDTVQKQLGMPLSQTNIASLFEESEMGRNKPILLLHGTNDRLTPFSHALKIKETLDAQNAHVLFYPLEASDHLSARWHPESSNIAYLSTVRGEGFMENVLKFLEAYRITHPNLARVD